MIKKILKTMIVVVTIYLNIAHKLSLMSTLKLHKCNDNEQETYLWMNICALRLILNLAANLVESGMVRDR